MRKCAAKNIASRGAQKYILPVLVSIALLYTSRSFANDFPAVPTKTNINTVSDEFEKHITNSKELEQQTEDLKNLGIQSSKSSNVSDLLSDTDLAKMNSEQSRLSSIGDNNLEDQGRDVRNSTDNVYFDDFETDYTKPGAIAHLEDAEKIAALSAKKLDELTKVLRDDLKINCEPYSKLPEVTDPYLIDTEDEVKEHFKFYPHFCEHLRNTYGCSDTMTMTCEKKSMKWYEWKEPVTIKVPGSQLIGKGYNFFYTAHVASKIFELKLFAPHRSRGRDKWGSISFDSVPEMRRYIADQHKVTPEHVSSDMSFGWEGGTYGLGGKSYAWRTYVITYRLRDGDPICLQWSNERWDEICNLSK